MVKHWVEEYEKDKKTAMVELLTMLFEVIQCYVLIISSSEGYSSLSLLWERCNWMADS